MLTNDAFLSEVFIITAVQVQSFLKSSALYLSREAVFPTTRIIVWGTVDFKVSTFEIIAFWIKPFNNMTDPSGSPTIQYSLGEYSYMEYHIKEYK